MSVPAFVQAVGGFTSGATSLTVTFPSDTAAGNLIVVGGRWTTEATTASVDDNKANGAYTEEVGPITGGGGGYRGSGYFKENILAGADHDVTLTPSAFEEIHMGAHEVTNILDTLPVDVSGSNTGTGGTAVDSGPVMTVNPDTYAFGYCFVRNDPTNIVPNSTPTATERTEEGSGGEIRLQTQDFILASAGSNQHDWTLGAESFGWGGIIIAFKDSDAGGVAEIPAARPAWNYRLHA